MMDEVEIKFLTLDCGHTVVPDIVIGVCCKCGKVCCSRCLQLFNGKLFCPKCFSEYVRDQDGHT